MPRSSPGNAFGASTDQISATENSYLVHCSRLNVGPFRDLPPDFTVEPQDPLDYSSLLNLCANPEEWSRLVYAPKGRSTNGEGNRFRRKEKKRLNERILKAVGNVIASSKEGLGGAGSEPASVRWTVLATAAVLAPALGKVRVQAMVAALVLLRGQAWAMVKAAASAPKLAQA